VVTLAPLCARLTRDNSSAPRALKFVIARNAGAVFKDVEASRTSGTGAARLLISKAGLRADESGVRAGAWGGPKNTDARWAFPSRFQEKN